MGENTTALTTMFLMLCIMAPVVILVNSIPEPMINWPVMYFGGALFVFGVLGLGLSANWKYLFKKKEE